MHREYHVLDSSPGDAEIFEAMFEVLVDLADRDYLFNPPFHKDVSDTVTEDIWVEEGQRVTMTLVDDFEAPARYFVVESSTPEMAADVSARLRDHLSVVTVEALRDEATRGFWPDPGVLIRLAVASIGSFDRASYELLKDGLRHSDQYVRYMAAMAAGLTKWSQFSADLESLSREDSDEDVREMAGRAFTVVNEARRHN